MSKKRPRTIAREIARSLHIEDGDIIAFNKSAIGDDVEILRVFNALRTIMKKTDRQNCLVVVLDDLDGIAVLNEQEMMTYGWCRCEERNEPERIG